jgi:hypothetical protein
MEQSCCGPGRSDTSESALNVVSKITVIYNDKLIRFIEGLKRNVDVGALALKDTYMLMPIQKDIREYIIENQSDFDLVDRKKITENNHPNIFAIMICVIIHSLKEYSSFQEILDESQKVRWEIGMHSSNEPNDTGYANSYGEQNFRCACNKACSPENMFIISNLETGMNLATGCECITKTKFIEPHELKVLEKESKKSPHYIGFFLETHKKKMSKNLLKLKESWASIKEKFCYIGGNYGEHLPLAEMFFNNEYSNAIQDVISCNCQFCDKKTKKLLLVVNLKKEKCEEDEILSGCDKCVKILDIKIFEKHGNCQDCGDAHKNRHNNLCNICRKKEDCEFCGERDFLSCKLNPKTNKLGKKRCKTCNEKKYCEICDTNFPSREGWNLCNICFASHAKRCDCGKYILNPKYKKCFSCNFGNN